jgi:hypothetical protein
MIMNPMIGLPHPHTNSTEVVYPGFMDELVKGLE